VSFRFLPISSFQKTAKLVRTRGEAMLHHRAMQEQPPIELSFLDLTAPSSTAVLFPLVNGTVLDLSVLPSKMTVEAVLQEETEPVTSVDFVWDDVLLWTEVDSPYYLAGDRIKKGRIHPKSFRRFTVGEHTLEVTFRFQNGDPTTVKVWLVIKDGSDTSPPIVSPTATPTMSPSSLPSASPIVSPTATPTMSPSSLPTASPTDVTTGEPTIRLTPKPSDDQTGSKFLLIDAGVDDSNYVRANKDKTVTVDDPIAGAAPFDKEMQSYRWSGRMTYKLTGLIPRHMYKLTLGFVETYHCAGDTGVGKRIMDVHVRDEPFLEDYDVFEKAGGCFIAVFENGLVKANHLGKIKIEFTASVNRPMVSLITAEAVETV
jgi:hypothetical protein